MDGMTKRERVLAAIRRKVADAVPWQFDLTGAAADRLRAYYGTDDLQTKTGDHIVWVGPSIPAAPDQPPVEEGLVRDEFGVVWHRDARDRNVGDWGGIHS